MSTDLPAALFRTTFRSCHMSRKLELRRCWLASLLLWLVASAHGQMVTATVAVGSGPNAIAVNQATNKIYVANRVSNNVTVIDGATNNTMTIGAGSGPAAVAVNTVSNKVFVANSPSNNVTVIYGFNNFTSTLSA